MLIVKDYSLSIKKENSNNKVIVKNINLELPEGHIIAIIGANGVGKSSFVTSLLGFEGFERSGSVIVNDVETIDKGPDEISKLGVLMAFQSPPEIEGIKLIDLIIKSYKAINNDTTTAFKIRKKALGLAKILRLPSDILDRSVNLGFSGGERKKTELLQILTIEPKVAILDEIDSGLDYDSIEIVSSLICDFVSSKRSSVIVVSHNPLFIKKLNVLAVYEIKDYNLVYKHTL